MPEDGGERLHVRFAEKNNESGDTDANSRATTKKDFGPTQSMESAAVSTRVSSELSEDYVNALNLCLATVLSSIGTGLIAIAVSKLIETTQEIGFPGGTKRPLTIAVSVTLGGFFGAISWYWLRGIANRSFVQVADSIKGAKMRPVVTLINGAIQDIVVALGGSFGREAAPREIAAMWAGEVCDFLEATPIDRSLLIACGTGAGLAAVYSCPISGVLYTLEHTLHWKMSFKAVLLATVTSCMSTYVSSVAVETTHGLYHIQDEYDETHGKYSYQWPDKRLLFWSAIMGLAVVIPALCFRNAAVFVKRKQPKARLPALYPEERDIVWIYDHDLEERRKVMVTARGDGRQFVTVWYMGTDNQKSFTEKEWGNVMPEGARNPLILIWMPTASFALAVGAIRFPELLGNGAALASSALESAGEAGGHAISNLFMLFAMKIMYTLAILGSGAVGGTLTPSVSLGAVLGTICARQYKSLYWTTVPEEAVKAMSTISAAAFLSVAMKSPVTSGFLLLEFTAQAVDSKDLIQALRGNFEPLIKSKLAAGMVIPLFIAIFTAYLGAMAVDAAAKKCASRKKVVKRKSKWTSSSAQDLDLVQDQDSWSPDDLTQEACLYCAQMGILLSTFSLNAMIVVRWKEIHEAPSVAFNQYLVHAGIYTWVMSGIVGLGMWLVINYMNAYKEEEPLLVRDESEDDDFEDSSSMASERRSSSTKSRYVRSLSQTDGSPLIGDVLPIACAALCAFFASVIPYVPWQLATRSTLPARGALLCSLSCSMCFFGLFQAFHMATQFMKHFSGGKDQRLSFGRVPTARTARKRRRDLCYAIPKNMLIALLPAAVGGLVGFLYRHFHSYAQ